MERGYRIEISQKEKDRQRNADCKKDANAQKDTDDALASAHKLYAKWPVKRMLLPLSTKFFGRKVSPSGARPT